MKTKKQEFYLKNCIINTISDIFDTEVGDTKIFINDTFLCVISGDDIDKFINEFQIFINKYAI